MNLEAEVMDRLLDRTPKVPDYAETKRQMEIQNRANIEAMTAALKANLTKAFQQQRKPPQTLEEMLEEEKKIYGQ